MCSVVCKYLDSDGSNPANQNETMNEVKVQTVRFNVTAFASISGDLPRP